MQRFAATLVAEGSSDQALLPFIEFLLDEHCDLPHATTFASGLPSGALAGRIETAVSLYPCDMLFVHRDVDRSAVTEREDEIRKAVSVAAPAVKAVCIVPVRMTEAWLLMDVSAIRRAAGNPTGRIDLTLPPASRIEALADPKSMLFELLERASELSGRRLSRFDRNRSRRQVSGFMDDCRMLRQLPSFQHFEAQVKGHLSHLD